VNFIRESARSVARSLGYEIRRTGSHGFKRPIDFIRSRNVDLVVDVGANVGQYGKNLRKEGYAGWIVSFEPTTAAYKTLAAHASRDERWKILNMALGETEGTAEINVSEASVFSSILPQLPAAATFSSQAAVIRAETVRVGRLDDIFTELPQSRAAFLKIDTQGYEGQVLSGASECLSRFAGIQMELPIIHLYEGTWKPHEAIAYMSERGFEISNIMPVNYDQTDTASLVEVDCIFRSRSG
jgi:FkbM family methyltransferase